MRLAYSRTRRWQRCLQPSQWRRGLVWAEEGASSHQPLTGHSKGLGWASEQRLFSCATGGICTGLQKGMKPISGWLNYWKTTLLQVSFRTRESWVCYQQFTEMRFWQEARNFSEQLGKEGIGNALVSSDDPKACFIYQPQHLWSEVEVVKKEVEVVSFKGVPRTAILNLRGPYQGWWSSQWASISQRQAGPQDDLGELFNCTYTWVPQSKSLTQ